VGTERRPGPRERDEKPPPENGISVAQPLDWAVVAVYGLGVREGSKGVRETGEEEWDEESRGTEGRGRKWRGGI
jgi:hypothetical protein